MREEMHREMTIKYGRLFSGPLLKVDISQYLFLYSIKEMVMCLK